MDVDLDFLPWTSCICHVPGVIDIPGYTPGVCIGGPQFQSEYKMGRPVAFRALDIVAYLLTLVNVQLRGRADKEMDQPPSNGGYLDPVWSLGGVPRADQELTII